MSARLLIRGDDGALRSVSIDKDVRIGSASDNEIALTGLQLSPIQARVGVADGAPWIADAGGQGTWVNGEPVTRRALKHLDVVTVGREMNLIFLQTETLVAVAPSQPVAQVAGAAEQVAGAERTVLDGGDGVVPADFLKGGMDSPSQPVVQERTVLDGGGEPVVPADLLRGGWAGAAPVEPTVVDPRTAKGPPGPLDIVSRPGGPPAASIIGFREVSPPAKAPSIVPGADPNITRLPLPAPGEPPLTESFIIGVRLTGSAGAFESPLGRSVVGRGTSASIRIKRKEVSRTHAAIIVTPTEVTVEDQQSANGTSVNGTPAVGRRRLVEGDRLSFATFEFRVEILQLKRGV